MIAVLALALLQAAPEAAPAPVPAPSATQPASPRTLTGRFTCAAEAYEIQLTAAPLAGTGVVLDRLTIAGRTIDPGSLAEARRMTARLADVQSLDVRCRSDGGGELSVYGTQATPGTPPRRARLRGTLRGTEVTGLIVAVQR
ncbi:hypothetical protein [Sphingomonas radiodurans]|uniref:hypothetical protein n=1 Tax=Sphingomonas radiodurans TaxID=2890321 RepID=UPI001E5667BF|nr:hypothetical protein [Sphingomonas radiodurans]WBH17646.1 hypothetical protein LLW23_05965 [Sphingomonas radiodurans]